MKPLFKQETKFEIIYALIISVFIASSQIVFAGAVKTIIKDDAQKASLRKGAIKGCSPFDLGPDTVYFCQGSAINKTLTGPANKVYQWSTGESTQSIIVKDTGTYTLQTIEYGTGNLISNGDFSQGNSGFTTGYIYTPGIEFPGGGGRYDIVTNGTANISWAEQFTDHTTGSGKYMFIDGNSTAGIKVWQQNITVTPNTDYVFYAWVRNLSPAGDINPELNFDINGNNIGGIYKVLANPDPNAKKWNQFYTTWNSGANTSITISIEDNIVTPRYNDFAIDDISFSTLTCTTTDSVVITYKPGVPPTITVNSPTAICKGDSVQIMASGAGLGGKYNWTPSATLTDANIANPFAKPLLTTSYTVTGTDANDCSNTATVTVTLKTSPIADFYFNKPEKSICIGDLVDLRSDASNTYNYTYTQVGGPGPVKSGPGSNALNKEVFYTQSIASQDYSLSVTDPGTGCTASITKNWTFKGKNVSAGSNVSICKGTSTTLHATADAGTTFLWSPAGSLSDATSANPVANPDTTTTYTLTGNALSCNGAAKVTVTVIPVITTNTNANASKIAVCTGDSVTLFGSGGANYTWDNGVINQVSFVPLSTKIYTVTSPKANNCSSSTSDTITVTINTIPSVSAGADQVRCKGDTVTLRGFGADSYMWDNGVIDQITFSPLNTQTYTVTGTKNGCSDTASVQVSVENVISTPIKANATKTVVCEGDSVTLYGSGASTYTWNKGIIDKTPFYPSQTMTYTVWAQALNACSTSLPDSISIIVKQKPNVTAGSALIRCEGDTVTLKGAGADNYTWDNGVIDHTTFTAVATKIFTVTGTSNGCSDTASVLVTVNSKTANPIKANASKKAICLGESVVLFGTGASNYAWDNSVEDSVSFIPTASQTYTVTSPATNQCSLVAKDTITITVKDLPIVDAGNSVAVCPRDSVKLMGNGASTYAWNNQVINNISFVATQTKTYSVIGTSLNGCSATDTVVVSVYAPNTQEIKAVASATNICMDDVVTLTAQGGNNYTWDNGVTNNTPFSPLVTKTYTVTSKDDNGCKKSASVVVNVCEYKIPSGFSPNNDLVHDYFQIFNPLKIPIDVLIYNRWGNLVYEKKNYDDNFDGNANAGLVLGEGLPDGTYYLVAEATLTTGKVDKIVKYITLRR
jgi:gliding motility-associated-like protein